jgi:GDPmannose 4,6-dehydratase
VEIAFDHADLSVADHVVLDPAFTRPAEVDQLVGDSTKAARMLGWQPKTTFEQMIRRMVDSDHRLLARGDRSAAAAEG